MEKELLGRYRIGTLKISREQYMSAQDIDSILYACNAFLKDIKRNENGMTRFSISETKDLYCFIKDHHVLMMVYDKEHDILTQTISVNDLRHILANRYRIESRLINCDKLLTLKDRDNFNILLNVACDKNAIRGSPNDIHLDTDFDLGDYER